MFNIAIDGHVSSGKSTIAKGLAQALGIKVLDTGAIYRGLACAFKAQGYNNINQQNMTEFINKIKTVKIVFEDNIQRVIVNDVDYTDKLRLEEISMTSAQIAPYEQLREKVRKIQQNFAERNDCIMEGRDIGTEVLPKADIKFFVTASEEVRAKRRFEQLKNNPNPPTYEEVLKDLRERDFADEHRKVAPLKPAKESIIIDTTNQTLEQTINLCLKIIRQKSIK